MIALRDKNSRELLGELTEEELQALVTLLARDNPRDTDRYIDAATLDLMESEGAPASLVRLLRRTLGTRDGLEITWGGGSHADMSDVSNFRPGRWFLAQIGVWALVFGTCFVVSRRFHLDEELVLATTTGVAFATLAFTTPGWFWNYPQSQRREDMTRLAMCVLAAVLLWTGWSRWTGIAKARAECLSRLAAVDYLHRNEVLRYEPVPNMPHFYRGRGRRYTCADFAQTTRP